MLNFDELNETQVRERLERIRAERTRLQGETEMLGYFERAYDAWLQLHVPMTAVPMPQSVPTASTPARTPVITPQRGAAKLGALSVGEAVRSILQANPGRAMHVSELWEQAKAMGAKTQGAKPIRNVDSAAHYLVRMRRAEALGGRRYRWKLSAPITMASEAGSTAGQPTLGILERSEVDQNVR